jgi:tight adherence protein B
VLIEPGVVRVLGTVAGMAALAIASALTLAGRRWMRSLVARARPTTAPTVVALEAVRAALSAGADVCTALGAVGRALGPEGAPLSEAAAALAAGSEWDQAWAGVPDWLAPLARALALPWAMGAQAAPMLSAAADVAALHERRAAQVAASELAVRLTLPLALCQLPAFIVAGIVPLVLALVGGL